MAYGRAHASSPVARHRTRWTRCVDRGRAPRRRRGPSGRSVHVVRAAVGRRVATAARDRAPRATAPEVLRRSGQVRASSRRRTEPARELEVLERTSLPRRAPGTLMPGVSRRSASSGGVAAAGRPRPRKTAFEVGTRRPDGAGAERGAARVARRATPARRRRYQFGDVFGGGTALGGARARARSGSGSRDVARERLAERVVEPVDGLGPHAEARGEGGEVGRVRGRRRSASAGRVLVVAQHPVAAVVDDHRGQRDRLLRHGRELAAARTGSRRRRRRETTGPVPASAAPSAAGKA